MIDEILSLGFRYVELSHGLSVALLPGIMKAYDEGRVRVSGVHNYFPAPIDDLGNDAPDRFPFTSHRKEERELALSMTKRSMETAAKFGAGYIVLHMGNVSLLPRRECTNILVKMVKEGKINTPEYARTKLEIVTKRRKLGALYYDRAREALDELIPLAQELNIKLGIEGRSHFEQIPNEEEMNLLMEAYKDESMIGYWHDFGHITRQENLLLLNHDRYLRGLKPHIIGGHVNDVVDIARDHQIPFQGTVPFGKLLPYFPKGCPLVWELSSRRKAGEIIEARLLWEEKFPDYV